MNLDSIAQQFFHNTGLDPAEVLMSFIMDDHSKMLLAKNLQSQAKKHTRLKKGDFWCYYASEIKEFEMSIEQYANSNQEIDMCYRIFFAFMLPTTDFKTMECPLSRMNIVTLSKRSPRSVERALRTMVRAGWLDKVRNPGSRVMLYRCNPKIACFGGDKARARAVAHFNTRQSRLDLSPPAAGVS